MEKTWTKDEWAKGRRDSTLIKHGNEKNIYLTFDVRTKLCRQIKLVPYVRVKKDYSSESKYASKMKAKPGL